MDSGLPLPLFRWRRMAARMRDRREWHDHGVLLWVLQRPYLRYLPCPYPNVADCQGWKLQVESMMLQKVWPMAHLQKGLQLMNPSRLSECLWLRDRIGFHMAFLEDPMVGNMLLVRGFRGQKTAIHREAMRHQQELAEKELKAGKEEENIRSLIGPRGGLPTLKADLVRLAVLLHQPVLPKDTVESLKEKIRGPLATVVATMKHRDTRSRASKDATAMMSSSPKAAPSSKPSSEPHPSIEPHPAHLLQTEVLAVEARLQHVIQRQDQRFQQMFNQMMTYIQNQPQIPQGRPQDWIPKNDRGLAPMEEEDVFDQTAREMGCTREEVLQLNAEHMAELAEENMKGCADPSVGHLL